MATHEAALKSSLALPPAHARGHQFVTRYPKASDISSPPCLLRLLPAGANRRVGLAPTGKRRLVTAHPLSGRSLMRLRFGARRRKADFQFLSACVEQLTSCPGGGVIPAPISRRGHSSNCPTVPVFCRTLGAG